MSETGALKAAKLVRHSVCEVNMVRDQILQFRIVQLLTKSN